MNKQTSAMIDPLTAQVVEAIHLTRSLKVVDHGTSIDLYRTLSYLPRITLTEEEFNALTAFHANREPLAFNEAIEEVEALEVLEEVGPTYPPMAKKQRLPKTVKLSAQARRICGGSNGN